jgi:hypothetical protein
LRGAGLPVPHIASQDAVGTDHTFYREVGQRWLDTGVYYLPHQLAGPYQVQADVDVLYPPLALLLFVPLVWLPFPLWWIVPGVVVGLTLWKLRPVLWTWPIMAALFAWPRGVSNLIYGNSDMWIATFICGGLLIAWPAVLVVIKPSVIPFALIGSRRRSWWIAAGGLAILSLFMIQLWQGVRGGDPELGRRVVLQPRRHAAAVHPGRRLAGSTRWRLRLLADVARGSVPSGCRRSGGRRRPE